LIFLLFISQIEEMDKIMVLIKFYQGMGLCYLKFVFIFIALFKKPNSESSMMDVDEESTFRIRTSSLGVPGGSWKRGTPAKHAWGNEVAWNTDLLKNTWEEPTRGTWEPPAKNTWSNEVTRNTEPLKNIWKKPTRGTWEPPAKDIWSNEVTRNTEPLKNTWKEPTSDARKQPAVKDIWGNEVTRDSIFVWASPISNK
jgi:hypothetical protein